MRLGGNPLSIIVYLVRHGEVEHHRTDVGLTPRGRAQAEAAGEALATRLADGDSVSFQHSPVTRVLETAELLRGGLSSALAAAGRADRVALSPLHTDVALCNVRFILAAGQEPEEPSLLYTTMQTPEYLQSAPPAWADFYRGFWTSHDPMGYWLTHDSAGAAETPEFVLARMKARLYTLFAGHTCADGRLHWIGVTHSGAMRDVLRAAFGEDPGEPDFCEVIVVEPSGGDRATVSYRGRSAPLMLADSRSPTANR
jgi:broad specificity phosphatase PhoE